jgi:hypothetical protein
MCYIGVGSRGYGLAAQGVRAGNLQAFNSRGAEHLGDAAVQIIIVGQAEAIDSSDPSSLLPGR